MEAITEWTSAMVFARRYIQNLSNFDSLKVVANTGERISMPNVVQGKMG